MYANQYDGTEIGSNQVLRLAHLKRQVIVSIRNLATARGARVLDAAILIHEIK